MPGGAGVREVGGQGQDPVGAAAVQLADHEGPPVAAQYHSGFQHVGAEVDERLHDAPGADGVGQHAEIQAVLQRHDVRAIVQAPGQDRRRRRGVMRLDREQDRPVEPLRQVVGQHRGHRDGEALHGPLDAQAPLVDGVDDRRIGVADQHIMAVTGQAGGDRTADGTASEHEVGHGAQRYNTVNPLVQASPAIYKRRL